MRLPKLQLLAFVSLSLAGACAPPAEGANHETSGDGQLGAVKACPGAINYPGGVFGNIDVFEATGSHGAFGAVLEFMTPHTGKIIQATANENGAYSAFTGDIGETSGGTITYEGATYALPAPIDLDCEAAYYNWAFVRDASGFLKLGR